MRTTHLRDEVKTISSCSSSASATAASNTTSASDATMARWLQSAGLQHLAFPSPAPVMDPRLLQHLLLQVCKSGLYIRTMSPFTFGTWVVTEIILGLGFIFFPILNFFSQWKASCASTIQTNNAGLF